MRWITVLIVLMLLAGCATHSARYRYQPHPVELIESTEGTRAARAMVSIVGLRLKDREADTPAGMDLAVRLENIDADRVTFDPASLQLLTGELRPFANAIVEPAEPVELARGESANFRALFPLTAEVNATNADFDGLNVRLTMTVDGERVTRSATFEREQRERLYGYHHHHGRHSYHRYWGYGQRGYG